MQLSLVQFEAIATGGPGDGASRQAEEVGLEPIEITISECVGQDEKPGFLHRAAEFLITSLTGCSPKR